MYQLILRKKKNFIIKYKEIKFNCINIFNQNLLKYLNNYKIEIYIINLIKNSF